MFVAINNRNMNIHNVEKWIRTARDDNGGLISPEFAMEILGKTNHLGHIKKVLANIKKNCTTKEEIEPYREFILSCVDGREMSADALKMLLEMATLCGCEDEFKVANGKLKIYGKFDCNETDVKVVKSKEEFDALEGENLKVFFDADKADLSFCNLREIKELKFKEGAIVNLRGAENLPEDLDISMCDEVDFRQCMLIGIKKLKFKEGAKVNFMYARYLPKELDVSMCNWVKFNCCDLSGVEKIKFKNIKQKNDYMDGSAGFKGKVVYSTFDLEDKFKRIFNKYKE
jgi:hypothetical protein